VGGLKDRNGIAREMKYTQANRQPHKNRRHNSIHAERHRRMAVSYECEQCNSQTVTPSAGSVSSKRRALAKLPSLVPKPRAHGGTANFALECESELDRRGAAPHVSFDQETWRPKVVPKQRPGKQIPSHHCTVSNKLRLPMHKLLRAFIIIECRRWIPMSRLRGRSDD
jgi:hypothetical protein